MHSLSLSPLSSHRHASGITQTIHLSVPRPGLARPARATAETKTSEEEASTAPSSICTTCGIPLANAPRGCDQKGRVAGGLGALASWFPIKAYRPCPALTDAGMNYARKGQILDQMLFPGKKERKP